MKFQGAVFLHRVKNPGHVELSQDGHSYGGNRPAGRPPAISAALSVGANVAARTNTIAAIKVTRVFSILAITILPVRFSAMARRIIAKLRRIRIYFQYRYILFISTFSFFIGILIIHTANINVKRFGSWNTGLRYDNEQHFADIHANHQSR